MRKSSRNTSRPPASQGSRSFHKELSKLSSSCRCTRLELVSQRMLCIVPHLRGPWDVHAPSDRHQQPQPRLPAYAVGLSRRMYGSFYIACLHAAWSRVLTLYQDASASLSGTGKCAFADVQIDDNAGSFCCPCMVCRHWSMVMSISTVRCTQPMLDRGLNLLRT